MMKHVTKLTAHVPAMRVPDAVITSTEPVLLKGLVYEWPLVKAGLSSDDDVAQYLLRFYSGTPVGVMCGLAENEGRYFYNSDTTGFNFSNEKTSLKEVLARILEGRHQCSPPTYYVGSTSLDDCLPGLRAENDIELPLIESVEPLVSIWIGNRSRIACHYDAPYNIACCAVGERRFTLFPPDQIANLYPGPLDVTPAGQAISMVDFNSPELVRYPRFRDALHRGLIAELEPGDALYIPSMWWHHVESFGTLNTLVNYWWRTSPKRLGVAVNALYHAMLSIRDLPEQEKLAWRAIFDYYVFGDSDVPAAHLPEAARGMLGPMDDLQARRLRALLINKLNR